METEIPTMLRARELVLPERFTFHSSRMRMKRIVEEELEAMDADSDRCAVELSDASVDVLGYACPVVAAHDPAQLPESRLRLNLANVDDWVPSACVQMQSLPLIDRVERESGLRKLSAKVATLWQMLRALKLPPAVRGCGALLSLRHPLSRHTPPRVAT